ncbi:MAG: hypothetical protein WHX93_06880 [bacterium]
MRERTKPLVILLGFIAAYYVPFSAEKVRGAGGGRTIALSRHH